MGAGRSKGVPDLAGDEAPVGRPAGARTLPAGFAQRRESWMDVVRGGAVTLVVLLHAVVLTANRGGLDVPAWTEQANEAVAPFRIPVLVLLSGMLLEQSLRKGTRRFFEGKLRHVAWPYLVWTAVYLALIWPVESVLGYLGGATYLWFLLFLLVYYAAAWATSPLPTGVVVVVALVGAFLAPDETKYGERLLYLFALFMAGSMVVARPRLWVWLGSSPWATLIGLGLLALQVPLTDEGGGFGPHTLSATLGGLLLGVQVARRVGSHRALAPLAFVGRRSLVFYVVHYPVIVLAVAAATAVGLDDGAQVVVLSAVVALAACTLLALGRDRAPVRWLFTAPGGRPRATAAAAGAAQRGGTTG